MLDEREARLYTTIPALPPNVNIRRETRGYLCDH